MGFATARSGRETARFVAARRRSVPASPELWRPRPGPARLPSAPRRACPDGGEAGSSGAGGRRESVDYCCEAGWGSGAGAAVDHGEADGGPGSAISRDGPGWARWEWDRRRGRLEAGQAGPGREAAPKD